MCDKESWIAAQRALIAARLETAPTAPIVQAIADTLWDEIPVQGRVPPKWYGYILILRYAHGGITEIVPTPWEPSR